MAEEIVFDFGLRLQQLRQERGMTQGELARRLGLSKETVYRYEHNLQDPSLKTAVRLAVLLRTSLDYLTGLDDAYTIRLSNLTMEERYVLELFLQTFVEKGKV